MEWNLQTDGLLALQQPLDIVALTSKHFFNSLLFNQPDNTECLLQMTIQYTEEDWSQGDPRTRLSCMGYLLAPQQ